MYTRVNLSLRVFVIMYFSIIKFLITIELRFLNFLINVRYYCFKKVFRSKFFFKLLISTKYYIKISSRKQKTTSLRTRTLIKLFFKFFKSIDENENVFIINISTYVDD